MTDTENDIHREIEPASGVYKTLLESTKAIPWKLDWASKQFTYIGPQIEQLLGWRQSSWLSVNDWAERMHADDREAAVNYCVAQSAAGIDHEFDYRALTRDGSYVWIRDVVHVVRNHDGTAGSLIGFMFDISERKEAEEERIRLHKQIEDKSGQLEVASRHKSEFLAHLSHELRTPMNAVIGMAELALETELTDVQRDCLTTVKASGEALLSLINDILDISKIEAGKLELDAVPFSLRQTLAAVVKSVGFPAQQKGLALISAVAPEVPDALIGDPGRLRQIMINLLGNAIKFTAKGEVALRVGIEADGALHVVVADTGIGIPAEHQGKIFEAFTQADISTTRRFGGTGLGLTISAQLVSLMGGRIWVESTSGQGTVFHFTARMPRATEPVSTPMAPGRSRRISARPRRVLLADDSVPNQKVAKGFLDRWGHTVVVASNGREALAALDGATFDLVLMDVQMPEMDGFQATAAIREGERSRGGHIPIVAMTASVMKGDRQRCLDAGMDGYVAKPIDSRELFELIERIGAPPSSPPAAGPLDRAAVLARFEDDAELARDTIEACLEEYRGLMVEIGDAIARGDSTAVRRGAHRLKGSLGHFSPVAAEAAERLGSVAHQGELAAAIWADLEPLLHGLEPALRALLDDLG